MILIATNLAVAVLLIASIAFHLRTIRKIDAFKQAARDLGPLIEAYTAAVDRAETSTGQLHEAADTYRAAAQAGALSEPPAPAAPSPAAARSPAMASMIQQIRARSGA